MKPQFTLRSLLMTFVVMALSLAVCGFFGIMIGAIILGLAWLIGYAKLDCRKETPRRYPVSVVELLLVIVALIGVLLTLAIPVVSQVGPSSLLGRCHNNLRQIGRALQKYQDAHGRLPPVGKDDFQGQPRISWRVLILPYLEQEALFHEYQQSEPWDGPQNRQLSDKASRLHLYRCQADWDPESPDRTSYVAVLGPDGNWLPSDQPKTDGLNPVRVVEVCDSGIHWMKPQDLPLQGIGERIAGAAVCGLSSKHVIRGDQFYYDRQLGAHALFADGSVRLILPDVPADIVQATLRGDRTLQEALDTQANDYYYRGKAQPNWRNWAALWSLIGCTVLLWGKAVRDRWRQSRARTSSDPQCTPAPPAGDLSPLGSEDSR